MALVSPIRKEIEKAARDIDTLNRLYNVYFQGGEDDPPRKERKELDSLVAKIKSLLATSGNASDKFQANTLVSRYQTMAGRWDRLIRNIENGTTTRPKKRE